MTSYVANEKKSAKEIATEWNVIKAAAVIMNYTGVKIGSATKWNLWYEVVSEMKSAMKSVTNIANKMKYVIEVAIEWNLW